MSWKKIPASVRTIGVSAGSPGRSAQRTLQNEGVSTPENAKQVGSIGSAASSRGLEPDAGRIVTHGVARAEEAIDERDRLVVGQEPGQVVGAVVVQRREAG